ncbi:MAG: hypothetical protein IKA61_05890 [Clostridia bacterium]|nr:hypothetical protein [Clostridia bacterium]
MYCYFLCDVPCAVKLDGVYIGVASYNLSFIEREKCFLEFIPLDEGFEKICLLFNSQRPISTKNVRIIDLSGGFLLVPKFFRRSDGEFKMIGKKTLDLSFPVNVTCFSQNGVKLCVATSDDFFIESLPFTPKEVHFDACSYNGNRYLVAICIHDKTEILAFKIDEKISLVFKNLCDGYSLDKNVLTTYERRCDVLRHSVCSSWAFEDEVRLTAYTLTHERQIFALHERLVAVAFFEELLIDGDVSTFLAPNLKPRASQIKEFLGSYERVLPPPHFMDDDTVMLLYNDKAEYAKLTLSGGLVSNVIII